MAARMTGARKAAVLLLSMGEEAAAEVLKNLSEREIREITQQMAEAVDVTPQQVDRVMNEFYLIAERARILPEPPVTKIEYMRKVLARALGDEKASAVVDGLAERPSVSTLEKLKWHDPQTIAHFIAEEHPQVVAVILANLGDAALARSVVEALPPEMQEDVFTRFVRIRDIPAEWLEEIEASLSEEFAPPTGAAESVPAGERQVARLLGTAPSGMEERLIEQIRQRNPELADSIQQRIFAFADLLKLDNYGLQQVLRRVPGSDLVLALKLADEPLVRHILRNMSDKSGKQLRQAVEGLPPTPIARIEAAQRRIANTARSLIEGGEIYPLQRRKRGANPQPAQSEAVQTEAARLEAAQSETVQPAEQPQETPNRLSAAEAPPKEEPA